MLIDTVTHAGSLIALGSEKPMKLKVPGSTAGTAFAGEQALALPVWSFPLCVSTLGEGTERPVTASNVAAVAVCAPTTIRAATTSPIRTNVGMCSDRKLLSGN